MDESIFDSTLEQLNDFKATSPDKSETTDYWINAISERHAFLKDGTHDVVFIGKPGVGKSTVIGIAANLLVGGEPHDKKSLKNNSVLSIGSGRTTICEVRIRSPRQDETGALGLVIDPVDSEEMKREISIYAESEWYRHNPNAKTPGDDDTAPTPQEIQRAIRNMTGYAEYREPFTEDGKKKFRTIRHLDAVVSRFDSHEKLAEHLVERARLAERTETQWWWNEWNPENLQALKTHFEDINLGRKPTAMLPSRMEVVIPEANLGDGDLLLTFIDTRGVDGPAESRSDLYNYMRNPRSVIVLCAPFRDAPGAEVRSLLHGMSDDATLRETIPRTLIVLLDQDMSSQVNGADDDREFGQELKIDECLRAFEMSGFAEEIDKDAVIAFDALQDDRGRLKNAIAGRLTKLRETVADELEELANDARNFLDSATNELRPKLCSNIDNRIKEIMAQTPLPLDPPLDDPLAGLFSAIRATRYASVVYASCRRNGEYAGLNLYTAIRSKASKEATRWLDSLMGMIRDRLEAMKAEEELRLVRDHIRRREKQLRDAHIEVTSDYADRVEKQIRTKLKVALVWNKCLDEWGRGPGFKIRVLNHLEEWGNRQHDITAHEATNARKIIPLLDEACMPPQAPRFVLHVRNLRILKRVDWNPAQVSAVIGANGTGKTTLLLVLKLMKVAYERGLPEAVSQVLGGSGNLRTWGANEDEPIEIGVDIGTASWRVQLVPQEGTVDYQTNESLSEREGMIFTRDALGGFSYKGERIEPGSKLGLKILMDRGVHEPALRKVALFLQGITVCYEPDLWSLRHHGSSVAEDRILHSRGGNALTLLRRWYQERTNQYRYKFVMEGLAAAFPNIIEELDFVEAGNTLVARTYRPGRELPGSFDSEANGVLQLLVMLCALASAENESVIALDEPENGLHPYALRAFLRRAERWARQNDLTVLLATHSTVILDELSASPEQVYVMKPNESDESLPTRLDEPNLLSCLRSILGDVA